MSSQDKKLQQCCPIQLGNTNATSEAPPQATRDKRKNTNEKNKKIFRRSAVEHKAGESPHVSPPKLQWSQKIRSLSVNQTQHEEIPNTYGFLAKCYDEDEESKIATKQLSTNVQCWGLWKHQKSMYQTRGKQKQPSSLIRLSCGASMPNNRHVHKEKKNK